MFVLSATQDIIYTRACGVKEQALTFMQFFKIILNMRFLGHILIKLLELTCVDKVIFQLGPYI